MMDTHTADPFNPTAEDYSGLVDFRRRHVTPPAALYLTVDDGINVSILNPSQTASVNVTLRVLTATGDVMPFYYQYPNVGASGTATSRQIPSLEGYLLSATVSAPSVSRGAAYVVLTVRRGVSANDLSIGELLCEGYPGGAYILGYPFGVQEAPTAGAGLSRSVTQANPAAGADFTVTVPAGANWVLNSVSARLVTSATVATRLPALVISDGSGNVVFNGPTAYGQTATLTWTYTWSPSPTTPPSGGTQNVGLLSVFM